LDYLKTFAEADDSPTRRAWASGMRAHGHDAGKWMSFDVWAHRRLLSTRMECSANQCFVERSEPTLLLCYGHSNFCRVLTTNRQAPAQAPRLTKHTWTIEKLVLKMITQKRPYQALCLTPCPVLGHTTFLRFVFLKKNIAWTLAIPMLSDYQRATML
jgi:hypothetical protein